MLPVLFGTFVVLIVIGCPIAITLGVSSVSALLFCSTFDLGVAIQRMFTGVNSFPLMAIPFFMISGAIRESSVFLRNCPTL